jgi:DNA-binding NarL/FixJ family response regulator
VKTHSGIMQSFAVKPAAMQKNRKIQVVIIEDDETIRNSYHYLLSSREEIQVTNTFASYEDAAKELVEEAPDVLLLDVELPGKNGIDALPLIRKMLPKAAIIILTVYESEELIFKALTNGASGYLTKNVSHEKILSAIIDVFENGGAMSANVARLVIKSFRLNLNTPLSKRETEILLQIAEGKSRNRIADDLYIDVETVKTHIKSIYYKLDVHSKADAIKAARDGRFI